MTIHKLADIISPDPPGQEERAPWNTAIQPIKEEQDNRPCSDERETERVLSVSNKSVGEANNFSSILFPKKLWKMVESDQFKSIWWSEGGKSIAVNKDLFEQEVLARAGPLCTFSTRSMRSFIQQLNLYAFIKI